MLLFGLTIGMIGQQLALTQALRDPAVEYDMRAFNWLGRFTPIVEYAFCHPLIRAVAYESQLKSDRAQVVEHEHAIRAITHRGHLLADRVEGGTAIRR